MECKTCGTTMWFQHTSNLCKVAMAMEPDAPPAEETPCNTADCLIARCNFCGRKEKLN